MLCCWCVFNVLVVSISQLKMSSRRSFSIRFLLNPHSNPSRLAFFMKRGSRFGSSHRKRLLKSKILNCSPKVGLVAKEAEEHTSISISRNLKQCALFGECMALVHEKYPASPSLQRVCWFEILSPVLVLIHDASL